MCGIRLGCNFFLLHVDFVFSQHYFLKDCPFFYCGFLASLSKINWPWMCLIWLWAICSIPVVYIVCFNVNTMQLLLSQVSCRFWNLVLCCLWLCSFYSRLCGLFGVFRGFMNFRIIFSLSMKTVIRIFIGIALNL